MWISEGLDPLYFWQVTPLEFSNIMRGKAWAREERERRDLSLAWHIEAFHRQKRMPDLDVLLSPADEIANQTPDDILALLKQIKASGSNNMTIKSVEAPEWLLQ